ncbi:MAG: hypothetical protein MZV70_02340 [Desulfobacterales bacterium]|nr:hypothetical protein [Desulfobacterales bacterium]
MTSIVIENDGNEEWTSLKDNPDYAKLTPEELREKVKNAGIVGMGSAATHVKLSPPRKSPSMWSSSTAPSVSRTSPPTMG